MKVNPIKDLSPFERNRAIQQLGGATENEIVQFTSSIKTASLRTSAIVEQLRRDNSALKKDLDTISALDRRLRTNIPIIPGQSAVAGNIFPEPEVVSPGGIPIPKFPKIKPPTPPVPTPQQQPQKQPQTQPQTQEQKQEQPKTREKPWWERIPIPSIPPIPVPRLPDFEGIPGFAFAKDIDKQLTSFAGGLDKFLKEKPGTAMAFDLGTGGFGTAMSMLPAGARLLSRLSPGLAQKVFGVPAVTTLARPRTSTYGVPIGPQPARPMPKPGPLTPGMVAPRPTTVASPTSVPYEDILKGLPTATGGRLGGQTVTQRAPLLKGFQTGGLFRKGPVATPEEKALRQAFLDFGDEELLSRFDDPANIYSQLARKDVDEIVKKVYGRSDEITERIFGIKTSPIIKKPINADRLFGPNKYSSGQIDDAIDILKSGQAKGIAQPGSIGHFMQLDHPEVREQFLNYLLGARKTKEGLPNYGFFEKVLRQTGLLGDPPTQIDDDVFRFLLNYHKKVKLDIDPLLKELYKNELLDPSTLLNYKDRIGDVIKNSTRSPVIEPLVLPGGPQSSIMGRPRSMDLASLGIDTSVEIQEIYYIVG